MSRTRAETNRAFLARAVGRGRGESSDRAEDPVTAITEGAANGLHYPADVLRRSLPLWEGASVFVDPAGPGDWGRPGGRSVRDLAGILHSVSWDEERAGIRGTVKFLQQMSWLCEMIDECLALAEAGTPAPHIGLSADLDVERRGHQVTEIVAVYSLDVVMNPARGGIIEPSALAQIVRRYPQMTENTSSTTNPAAETNPDEAAISRTNLAEDLRAETCSALLAAKLAASNLPGPFREAIRDRFQGRTYAAAELDAEIERTRALDARLQEARTIQHLGAIRGMTTPTDRLQLAFQRLMGVPLPDEHADIPRLSGFRELYLMATGDYDFRGVFNPERVALANLTTSSLSSIVKNVLNKALLQAYELRPQWWSGVVWEEDFSTMNQVTWITTGGFADLPTVSEGAAYTELANLTDIEETSSFLKKGAYVGITLEMIDRDDVGAIRAIPRKMGLAANRTLSAAIAAIFTDNSGVGPTLGQDTTALFHADHGNLLTTALSLSAWDAVVQAMYKQTEPASSKRMGLRPAFLLVPIELEKTALEIMRSKELVGYGGGTNTLSPNANVRQASAGVVVVPEFTDANDWAAVAAPYDAPGICVGYRYGRTPELFVASDPLTGSMFTNDVMRIKARFVYTVGIGEYRALHKNNVA